MEAALVVYLISQLETWADASFATMLLTGAVLFSGGFFCYLEDVIFPKKLWIPLLVVFIAAGLFRAVLPSKKSAELMATAYGVQWAVQSPTGQQVLDKSGKIVNNVLDLAIQKTTPAKQ